MLLSDQGLLIQSRIFCTRWKGLVKGSVDGDAIDDKEYTRQYLEKLNRLLANGTLESIIENLKAHDKVLLLCYEGKYKFCHRHILADFLNEHFKLGISEL